MDPWTVVFAVTVCILTAVVYSFLKPYFQPPQTTVVIQDDHPAGAQRAEVEPYLPDGDPDFLPDVQPDIIEDNRTL